MTEKTGTPSPAAAGDEMTDQELWDSFISEETSPPDTTDSDAPGSEPGSDDDRDDGADQAEFADENATDPDPTDDTDKHANPPPAETIDWKAKAEELEHKHRSDQGRLKATQRKVADLQKEIDRLKAKPSTTATDEEIQQREQRMESLKAEYPDVAEPLIEEINSLRSRLGELDERDKDRLTTAEGELTEIVTEQWGVFTEHHPDGIDVIRKNRAAFDTWLEDQPKATRDIYAQNVSQIVDGTGTAKLVSQFKAFLQEQSGSTPPPGKPETRPSDRRDLQRRGAASTRSNTRKPLSGNDIPDTDDPEALWNAFDNLDAKKAARR
jgi:hypothetical protein